MKTYSTIPVVFVALLLSAVAGWIWLAGYQQGGLCWDCVLLRSHRHAPMERNSSASLKTIASAQADYRGNDRDGNGKQDYWRADIAGLYAVKTAGTDDAVKLIELSIAAADGAPVEDMAVYTRKAPKAGYWYKALRHADEDPARLDAHGRWAACCYPDSPATGKWAFVISEDNTIFRRAWSGPADTPSVYPDPATLKREWSKLD